VANTVAAQLFISGVWTTKPAFIEEEIEVQVGPDVETGTRPNEMNLTWDNSDLSMDPSNVLSALSGLIGRNTPARVMVGGTVLGVGEASSWQPDRSINHAVTPARGRSWTAFQAQGVLRRIGRWSNPFRSPIFRQISSYDVTKMLGYWSMEGGSTNLPNSISGGFTGKVTGTATWSAIAGPNGSDKVIQLGSDGAMSGSFIRAATGGWQLSFAGKLGSAIGSGTYVTLMRWRTSTGLTYEWQVNNAAFNVHITRDDGTVAADIAATFGAGVTPTTWTRFRCKVTAAGATITVEPAWYNQGATIFGTTGTFAGTSAGVLTNWDVFPTAATNNTGFGHLMATSDTTLDLTGNYDAYASFNGYSGETAAFRFQRLCTEEGIAKSILGAAASTVAMGPQPSGLFTDLLEECARTDHALIYDDPAAVALIFRTRINRYGQTSKLDLTYGNGQHVAPPLKKVIDDQGIANVFTVTNANGSSSTRRLTTGPLSTQSPPAGVGVYKGDVDVNQFDDTTLDDRAAWELNLATLDRPRYKQITVDLLGNPTLVTAANTVRPGDLITLAGVEPDAVPLHVVSYLHQIGHTTRSITFNCVPGDLWKTGAYDTTSTGNVYGIASCNLNALAGTTGTSLVVNVTDPLESWSTSATGYDLTIEGERVRVTTAFSAPSGGTQTATVTRSMNGVVRTHTAGAAVLVSDQVRYAY
jgi:hypothetical protein